LPHCRGPAATLARPQPWRRQACAAAGSHEMVIFIKLAHIVLMHLRTAAQPGEMPSRHESPEPPQQTRNRRRVARRPAVPVAGPPLGMARAPCRAWHRHAGRTPNPARPPGRGSRWQQASQSTARNRSTPPRNAPERATASHRRRLAPGHRPPVTVGKAGAEAPPPPAAIFPNFSPVRLTPCCSAARRGRAKACCNSPHGAFALVNKWAAGRLRSSMRLRWQGPPRLVAATHHQPRRE